MSTTKNTSTSSSAADEVKIYVKKGPSKYQQSAMTIKGKAQWTGVGDDLYLNPQYFCTKSGIIKLIELLFGIICLCTISPALTWFARLFLFFLAITFIITLLYCLAYLITLKNVFFTKMDWLQTELIYTILASLALLITAIIHLFYCCREDYRYSLRYFNSYIGTSYFSTYITSGTFGIFNSIVYMIGAYFLNKERKYGRSNSNNGGGNAVAPYHN